MKSIIEDTGLEVRMPAFAERKLYMHKSEIKNLVLPSEFQYFSDPVGTILERLKNQSGVVFITVDEKIVSGETHRRPGVHVDFNWVEDLKAHGGGSHPGGGGHSGGGHRNTAKGWADDPPRWNDKYNEHGGMLLVSNFVGCKGYEGEFDGEILEGGDCSLIDISALAPLTMEPNRVYYLNALGIHEPLVIEGPVKRTLIRVNFHHEYRWEGIA